MKVTLSRYVVKGKKLIYATSALNDSYNEEQCEKKIDKIIQKQVFL